MLMTWKCSNCAVLLSSPEGRAGTEVKCPRCTGVNEVPSVCVVSEPVKGGGARPTGWPPIDRLVFSLCVGAGVCLGLLGANLVLAIVASG